MDGERRLLWLGMVPVLIDPAEDDFLRRDLELARRKLARRRRGKRSRQHEQRHTGEEYATHQLTPWSPDPAYGAKLINAVGRNRGANRARWKRKVDFLQPQSHTLRQHAGG